MFSKSSRDATAALHAAQPIQANVMEGRAVDLALGHLQQGAGRLGPCTPENRLVVFVRSSSIYLTTRQADRGDVRWAGVAVKNRRCYGVMKAHGVLQKPKPREAEL